MVCESLFLDALPLLAAGEYSSCRVSCLLRQAEMRYEMELARRRLSLLEKLQRAATARKESVEARLAAMPQVTR